MPHRFGSPAPLFAREGREHQKYGADGERLVAGTIPVRYKPGVEGPAGVEVLLISSRGGKGHVLPKGGWEVDEDLETAALRETVEEAGVRGRLEGLLLGTFPFHSNKAERLHTAHKGRCIAHMFVLQTLEELAQWPEAGQRKRVWCSLEEACCVVRHEWMREALLAYIRRQGWEHLVCLPPPARQQQQQGAPPNGGVTGIPQQQPQQPGEPALVVPPALESTPERVAVHS